MNASRIGDGFGFLLDSLRARPVARRMLSGLSVVMAVLGVGLLAYPFYTNLVQSRIQTRLAVQFSSAELKQAYATGQIEEGDSLTRLRIPDIDVDVVVVEGTSASALKAGAGHYPNTPLPGEEGNVAVAGHRTTYGKPFANLDHLKPGSEIILETPLGRHVYKITREPFVVDKADFSVISQTSGHTLTLTTCHPKGSAKQRLVVKADMVPEASA